MEHNRDSEKNRQRKIQRQWEKYTEKKFSKKKIDGS